MPHYKTALLAGGLLFAGTAAAPGYLPRPDAQAVQQAQHPTQQPEDPAHDELRAFRDSLVAAVNAGDIERVVSHLHENVVMTAQNAEVSRGRAGVRAYFDKMMVGPDRRVERFTTNPTVDELTILFGGDTGISFGSSVDHYVLTNGMDFELASRWSAALVKEDGRWLISSFHTSTNLFDNPVLDLAKRSLYWVGALAGAVGLGLGILLTYLRGRVRRQPA